MNLTKALTLAAWLAPAASAGYLRGFEGSRRIRGESDVLCCNLGREMGRRTIRVSGDGSIFDRSMMSRMATCGERNRREYTKRQRKIEEFCLRKYNKEIDWEATMILGEDELDRSPTLRFEESDQGYRIFGNSGCNNVFGPLRAFSEVDRSFEAGSVASTRKYCRGLMEREKRYIKLLKRETLYYEMSHTGDTLSLFDSPDHDNVAPLAEFERVLPQS